MSNGVFEVVAKEKPKWFQFRWRVSNALVSWARWIRPENPEVKAFYVEAMMDYAITGQFITRVDPFANGEVDK